MAQPKTYGGAAAVAAAGVVLMHVAMHAWGPVYLPELQRTITDPLPLSAWARVVILAYLVLSVGGGVGVVRLISAGLSARDAQRWQHEQAARERQWARERQAWQRLQEIRDQLWLESLPADQRARILAHRRRERELEARARAWLEAEQQAQQDGQAHLGA